MAASKDLIAKVKEQEEESSKEVVDLESLKKHINSCDACDSKSKERMIPKGYVKSRFMIISEDAIDIRKTFTEFGIDYDTAWKTRIQKCISEIKNYTKCKECVLDREIKLVEPELIFIFSPDVANMFSLSNVNEKIEKNRVVYAYTTIDSLKEFIIENEEKIKEIRDKTLINYHHHNHFSLRDGLGDEKNVAKRLYELKSPGFSLTNHGNVHAHFRQYNACKEYGMKPVFGTEIYYNENRNKIIDLIKDDSKESIAQRKELGKETYHLTIVAKNKIGYYNLIAMNNEALMNSFYKNPLIDDRLIEKYKEGLVIFSGCAGAYIPRNLFAEDEAKGHELAYSKALKFKELFKEDFFIELMSTKYEHQKNLNARLVAMSKELSIPTVITNDCHYTKKELSKVHDILLLAGTDSTLEDAQDPAKNVWQFTVKDLYIKTPKEIYDDLEYLGTEEYSKEQVKKSFDNIHKLFSRIEQFEIDTSLKFPKLKENSNEYLMELLEKGITKKKYLVQDSVFKERLKLEYDTITSLGFADYFIVLQDVINYIKDTYGIYTLGAGRGSAAGSLISYLLGITDVNPMKYKMMLFERFLSPGRKDLVDIDCLIDVSLIRTCTGDKLISEIKEGDFVLDANNELKKVLFVKNRNIREDDKILEIVFINDKNFASIITNSKHRLINKNNKEVFCKDLIVGDKIASFSIEDDKSFATIVKINEINKDLLKEHTLIDIQVEDSATFQIIPFEIDKFLSCQSQFFNEKSQHQYTYIDGDIRQKHN